MTTASALRVTQLFFKALLAHADEMPADVARWLYDHQGYSERDRQRHLLLREKATKHALTPDENCELQQFMEIDAYLDVLKSRFASPPAQ